MKLIKIFETRSHEQNMQLALDKLKNQYGLNATIKRQVLDKRNREQTSQYSKAMKKIEAFLKQNDIKITHFHKTDYYKALLKQFDKTILDRVIKVLKSSNNMSVKPISFNAREKYLLNFLKKYKDQLKWNVVNQTTATKEIELTVPKKIPVENPKSSLIDIADRSIHHQGGIVKDKHVTDDNITYTIHVYVN